MDHRAYLSAERMQVEPLVCAWSAVCMVAPEVPTVSNRTTGRPTIHAQRARAIANFSRIVCLSHYMVDGCQAHGQHRPARTHQIFCKRFAAMPCLFPRCINAHLVSGSRRAKAVCESSKDKRSVRYEKGCEFNRWIVYRAFCRFSSRL